MNDGRQETSHLANALAMGLAYLQSLLVMHRSPSVVSVGRPHTVLCCAGRQLMGETQTGKRDTTT